jgi:hypothetical protein
LRPLADGARIADTGLPRRSARLQTPVNLTAWSGWLARPSPCLCTCAPLVWALSPQWRPLARKQSMLNVRRFSAHRFFGWSAGNRPVYLTSRTPGVVRRRCDCSVFALD